MGEAVNEDIRYYASDRSRPYEEYTDMGPGSYCGGGFELLHEKGGSLPSIGRFTSIGQNVKMFCGGYHRVDWVTTSPIHEGDPCTYSKGPVEIGSDCWVGHSAVFMSGVKVGHGAVVGAFSVVTKDVEPYAIVGGNPAKFIRFRFSEEQRKKLLAIAWWDWPEMEVRANQLKLCQPDIDAFIDEFYRE